MKKRKKDELQDQVDVEKFEQAHRFLLQGFASPLRETYLRGKTQFRDLLYNKMGCSLLEAEILVDSLEKNKRVEFRRFRKGMRYGEWEIHNIP
jgi:hypothetical protein